VWCRWVDDNNKMNLERDRLVCCRWVDDNNKTDPREIDWYGVGGWMIIKNGSLRDKMVSYGLDRSGSG
jgi:hypothetical protein